MVVDSYGNKWWYKDNRIHRDNDLPAIEFHNGDKFWYKDGRIHRDNDLPAIEDSNGDKSWHVNGQCHRDNGLPAHIRASGNQYWYMNGLRQPTPECKIMKDGTYYVLGLKLTVKKNKILNIE